MTKDSDQIREEIAATRGDLSSNVNALADSVKPGNVARRQVDKVRDAAVSTKDRVMGAAPNFGSAKGSASSKAGDVASTVSDAASGATGAVAGSPELVRNKTQGNPLAAGLIAFGAGLLVASLIPTTEREQQAAAAVKDNIEPLKQEVTSAAKQAADNLREPAQQAVASVKQTATDAVENTKQEGASAAQQVKEDTRDAAGTVQESRAT
jgi:gas vesicle protein